VLLLAILLAAGWLLVLGVGLWVLVKELLTTRVPPTITHPVKFRILHYIFQLILTWGNLLEKLKICSMPHFFRFIQDKVIVKKNPGVSVKDLHFGTIPVRLFQPKAASCSPRRGIVFYHGGGAVFGSLDCYHNLCSFLARETDSVVLSVGYRKLPDHHYPVIPQDCLNASIHFLEALQTYGVDPCRVVACGDSIGAGAGALVVQALLDRQDLPQFCAQVLIYPILQGVNYQLPSYQQNPNAPFLSRDFLMNCACKYLAIDLSWKDAMLKGACIHPDAWKKYGKWLSSDNIPQRFRSQGLKSEILGPFNEAAYLETRHVFEAKISPLLADDKVIAQLPKTFLLSLDRDVLRDDTLLYKKRLEDQGVPVTWCHMEDGFHGCIILFDKKYFFFPCSQSVANAVVSYIKGI
uniref:Arylacetamide deacetylase-like 4 n=1 Tax=Jaculus jaculus TaxID=51337 RepID=A0A8C5K6R5_JACJA